MKNSKNTIKGLFVAALGMLIMVSCSKYREYDNNEVVENTFTGNVEVTSMGSNPAGDFTGDGNSGTYSFVWENTEKTGALNFDITSQSGSVQFILNDKRGDEVLNETLTAGAGEDTFSGLSLEGKKGKWLVTMILTDFDGDGSYSLNPGK